jgi:hypothetical protein
MKEKKSDLQDPNSILSGFWSLRRVHPSERF